MNKNEFFLEATLRICGSLEIEEAMFSTLQFLRKEIPVDRIFLQFVDIDLKSLRMVAMATPEKAEKVDLLTPLSSKAFQELTILIDDYNQQKKPNFVWLFEDNPKKNAAINEVFDLHNMDVTSLMIMPLEAIGEAMGGGSLVLSTKGDEKFNQKHAGLISMLKDPFVIAMSNVFKHREITKLKELLADDNRYLHGELHRLSGDEIVGSNFGLRDVIFKVRQVAELDSPVLLLGETGVGKDVIANKIHYSSSRSNGPFVSVNCGAIPDTLIDSELFGHEKGAFTGALSKKRGRFERANKGTIFLDEIGELPLQAQVRLLKVLQDKEIERVGGVKTIPLDIRVIAATNRNMEEMLRLNQFREDLWFRINVFPIWIPPLRDRMVDLPALVQHFIRLKTRELNLGSIPTISPGSIELLTDYHWPGNIRELENVIERSLILNPKGPLTFENLTPGQREKPIKLNDQADEDIYKLEELIGRHIRKVLLKTNGKVNGPDGAAAALGVNPSTLRNRMKKLGIDYGLKKKL